VASLTVPVRLDRIGSIDTSARALIRASHPGPSLAITAMIVVLATAGHPGPATLAVFAVAVLAGELSIGWSNDVFDAPADAAAGRTDKPIVAGDITAGVVRSAAVVALLAGIALSFLVSALTGVVNLVMMAAGWAYNAGLKTTLLSGVAYVVGFGLIPVFAASAADNPSLPAAWATGAAALLGLGGHFANVLPDLAADRVSGVRGLPQRIAATPGGDRTVRVITLVLLLGASVLLVVAPGSPHWWQWAGLALAAGLGVAGIGASGRTPFFTAIAIAGLDVVLFISRV
jgi:4-hydroxybenzoate polyprenyltransferase